MFLFGIATFNTVTSFVKEAILMFAIGIYATDITVENYVSLPASSKTKVGFSFIKKIMQKRIEELKVAIGAIEKLVDQQPDTYIFLRFTLRVLKAKLKAEKTKAKKQNQ